MVKRLMFSISIIIFFVNTIRVCVFLDVNKSLYQVSVPQILTVDNCGKPNQTCFCYISLLLNQVPGKQPFFFSISPYQLRLMFLPCLSLNTKYSSSWLDLTLLTLSGLGYFRLILDWGGVKSPPPGFSLWGLPMGM